MSEEECLKKFNAGKKDLKTGFFSFKFSPDYTSASINFTDAARGFKALKNFPKAIESYEQAIFCYKKINDKWSAATCEYEACEIFFFQLKNINKGIDLLNAASYDFKVSGKLQQGVKVYTDVASKFCETKEYEYAEKILNLAFAEFKENSDDSYVRVGFSDCLENFLEVECNLGKYKESIKILEDYIESELKQTEPNKYKVSKSYIKLGLLRIIIGEEYLIDSIVAKMWALKYDDTEEDVSDLRKCAASIETLNKKDFNYCVNSAFSLFQNGILAALRKLYKEKEEKAGAEQSSSSQQNVEHHNPVLHDDVSVSSGATKATVNEEPVASNNNNDEFL